MPGPISLQANELFWMTDRTPHQSMPLAAGTLSPRAGAVIVLASLALSLGAGCFHPWLSTGPLRATLVGSALLGTIYSLPPFRLKRFPLCAALCIMYLFVRGIICMEWHENYMLDVWRDLTMVHPGASVLNPVPTGGPTPRAAEHHKHRR